MMSVVHIISVKIDQLFWEGCPCRVSLTVQVDLGKQSGLVGPNEPSNSTKPERVGWSGLVVGKSLR